MLAACLLVPTEAFLHGPSFAIQQKMIAASSSTLNRARSENSKRTSDRSNRGGPRDYQHGGHQEHDYSAGNLKYGTGKYTQRGNDGYQGGVNMSENGRSMQDAVYREDRNNVDRARGRPSFNSRMDEIEDLERGMPREGMRDRMMRDRRNGGGGDLYDDREGFPTMGMRDRMGGGGLLRDMQGAGGRSRDMYDDFGSQPKIMGGSSKGRHGGYRSSQFESGLSNERRRHEEFGFRMDDYMDERDGHIDLDGGRRRSGGDGRTSNFDRLMGRDQINDHDGEYYDHMDGMRESYGRNGRRGGRGGYDDDGPYDDYGEVRGRGGGGGGDGRLIRDMRH